ncbi:helix-turn-helix domain-containing protein [Eubacteriaceae bacterium ES3]|nr:helix-turn-helix domain-containing protein [Eubacteriaceae bacterium ES3]
MSLTEVVGSKEEVECAYIMEILDACQWNRSMAAKRMGISRRTLYNKIKKYELQS